MPRSLWIAIFVLGLIEVYSLLPVGPQASKTPAQPVAPYRSGIIHVHSVFSDGGGTPEEIAKAAEAAGLDFVVITDHDTSAARKEGLETTYGPVDAFVEMEASTPAGHCLVFFSHTDAAKLSDEAVKTLAWQHFLGREARTGFFIATAHPSHVKNPWSYLDRFPEGTEVLNFDAMWQRQLSESILDFSLGLSLLPFNQFLASLRFFQPYARDFVAWDGMNAFSETRFGFLGHDTHGKLRLDDQHSLRWPDYGETFKLASNVIYYDAPLETDFTARKKQLYKSLKQGRMAIAFHSIYPFAGNDWRYECDGEEKARAGQEGTFHKARCRFVVQTPPDLPYHRVLRLYRNGNLQHEVSDTPPMVTLPVDAEGLYRLEVWTKPRTALRLLLNRPVPYVFYNPIRVR